MQELYISNPPSGMLTKILEILFWSWLQPAQRMNFLLQRPAHTQKVETFAPCVPSQANLFPDMQIITRVQSNPGIITVDARQLGEVRAGLERSQDAYSFLDGWQRENRAACARLLCKNCGII